MHPHGYCYRWEPSMVLSLSVSDSVTWLAYMILSAGCLWLALRMRKLGIPYAWAGFGFAAFIHVCGWTHWMDVATLYDAAFFTPDVIVRIVTAGISLVVALGFLVALPRISALFDHAAVLLSFAKQDDLGLAIEQGFGIPLSEADRAKFLRALRSVAAELP